MREGAEMWLASLLGAGEHHGGSGLAEVQAGTFRVKRAAGFGREGLERLEAGDDELREHIRTDDHGVAVTALFQLSLGHHLGGAARYAGVAHHDGFVGIAEVLGNKLGGAPQVGSLGLVALEVAQQFDVSFGGGEDEQHLAAGGIDAGASDGVGGRQEGALFHLGVADVVRVGQCEELFFQQCVVDDRCAERLWQREPLFVGLLTAVSCQQIAPVLLGGEPQGGNDVISDFLNHVVLFWICKNTTNFWK